MTHWPKTDTCFRHLFLVPETMTRLAGKWYRHKKMKMDSDCSEICFFLYCSVSWKKLSSPHFIFYFCLRINKQCYRLLRLSNHCLAFPLVSGTKLNML